MSELEIILLQDEDGDFCHDVKGAVGDSNADALFRAFERFCQEKTASCYGCVGCCQERVPVTSVDALRLRDYLGCASWQELCRKYLTIEKLPDGAIDICLRRDAEGCCLFMDRQQACCSIHPGRTFACATHYCLPRSRQLADLRSRVINQGMDELVRLLIAEGLLDSDIADYPPNAFTGKRSYAEIELDKLK